MIPIHETLLRNKKVNFNVSENLLSILVYPAAASLSQQCSAGHSVLPSAALASTETRLLKAML